MLTLMRSTDLVLKHFLGSFCTNFSFLFWVRSDQRIKANIKLEITTSRILHFVFFFKNYLPNLNLAVFLQAQVLETQHDNMSGACLKCFMATHQIAYFDIINFKVSKVYQNTFINSAISKSPLLFNLGHTNLNQTQILLYTKFGLF